MKKCLILKILFLINLIFIYSGFSEYKFKGFSLEKIKIENYSIISQKTLNNLVVASIKPVCPTYGNAGDEFWVEISVGDPNNVTNLFGTSFDLLFSNTSKVDYVSCEAGSFLGNDVIFYSNTDEANGKVSVGITRKSPATGVSGSGVIARIKFRSLSSTSNNTAVTFNLVNISTNDQSGSAISLLPVSGNTTILNTTYNGSISPVSPSSAINGDEFWVDIKVGDPNIVSNLFGVSLDLTYSNTAYIDFVSAEKGAFLGDDVLFYPSANDPNGRVSIGITKKAGAIGANGSGIIARVKFKVLSNTPNNTTINFSLNNITANNPSGTSIVLTPSASSTSIFTSAFLPNLNVVSPANTTPGGQFWIELNAGNPNSITNLFGLSFDLLFSNTEYLDYLSFESGTFLGNDILTYSTADETNGKISVGLSRKAPAGGVNGSGTIARIKFQVSPTAPDNLKFIFNFANIVVKDPGNNTIYVSTNYDTTSVISLPQIPTLVSPTNGFTGASTSTTLGWNAISGATGYKVQVSTVSDFSTLVIDDSTITTISKELIGLQNNTIYYWRVKARNSIGYGDWSSIWNFTTINNYTISGIVTLNGSAFASVTVRLSGGKDSMAVTGIDGRYTFIVNAGSNYSVTPARPGYTFSPLSQTFNNIQNNQTQNFAATLNTYTISGTITSIGVAISSVTVTLSGGKDSVMTTTSNGQYSFTVNALGDYTVTPTKNNYTFYPVSKLFSSVTSNQIQNFTESTNRFAITGTVNSEGQGLAGVSVTLTGGKDSVISTGLDGTYSFTSLVNGSYTITPVKTGYTFTPQNRAVTISGANQTDQNFTASAIVNITIDSILAYGERGFRDSSVTKFITITNTSADKQVTVTSIAFSPNNGIFTYAGTTVPFYVSANSNVSIPVRFNPNEVGNYSATMTISNSSNNKPSATISISGNVIGSTVQSLKNDYNFGDIGYKADPKDTIIKIKNTGAYKLKVSGFNFASTQNNPFSVITSPGAIVEPGAEYGITIRITPYDSGAPVSRVSNSLSIITNATPNNLSGISLSATMKKTSVEFIPPIIADTTHPDTTGQSDTVKVTVGTFSVPLNGIQTTITGIIPDGYDGEWREGNILVLSKNVSSGIKKPLSVMKTIVIQPGHTFSFILKFKPTVTGIINVPVNFYTTDPLIPSKTIIVNSFVSVKSTPAIPTLTSPGNNSSGITLNPTLNWNASNSAISYTIQVSSSPTNWNNLIVNQSNITYTSYSLTTTLLKNTTYYWRVNAINAAGASLWSNVWSFTTKSELTISGIITCNSAPLSGVGVTLSGSMDNLLTTRADGTFSFIVNAGGNYTITPRKTGYALFPVYKVFSAINSSQSQDFIATLNLPEIPELLQPANNSNNSSRNPILTWNPSSLASSYRIEISADSLFTFGYSFVDTSTSNCYYQTNNLNFGVTYYWRVRGKNLSGYSSWSVIWSFSNQQSQLKAPSLVWPVNNSTNLQSEVQISWNSVTGASEYLYHIAEDQNFTMLKSAIRTSSTSVKETGLKQNSTYFWRVRAEKSNEIGQWSEVWKFTTMPLSLLTPVLSLPLNNSVVKLNYSFPVVTLEWAPVWTAVEYQIQVSEKPDFSTIYKEESGYTLTNYKLAVTKNIKYYWRVKANNSTASSVWSEVWSFNSDLVGVDKLADAIPTSYTLKQNYPNPFNPETVIEYSIPENSFVIIKVYNTFGKELDVLVNRNQPAGKYRLNWQPKDLPSGVYYYKLQAGRFSEMRKMIYLR